MSVDYVAQGRWNGEHTVMAVQLSSNDKLARGQFCLDGVDDFENKPCAVFEASSVLNVNIRQPAYPEQ